MNFKEWWDRYETQYLEDSCHMSEYHMASVVWNAAIGQAEIAIASVDHNSDDSGLSENCDAMIAVEMLKAL